MGCKLGPFEDIAVLTGANRPRFGPADVISNSPLCTANIYQEELSVILMGCNKPVVGSRAITLLFCYLFLKLLNLFIFSGFKQNIFLAIYPRIAVQFG